MLAMVVGSTGCATLARPVVKADPSSDDVTITVFNDGFHSGFLVPIRDRFVDLDTVQPPAGPVMEVGYAADAWVMRDNPNFWTMMTLAIQGGPGLLWCQYQAGYERPQRTEADPIRYWRFRLSRPAWQRFQNGILTWTDSALDRPRSVGHPTFIRFSPRSWSMANNCNDFVIDNLAAAGIDPGWRFGYTSGVFSHQLDEIQSWLRQEGIEAIGIGP